MIKSDFKTFDFAMNILHVIVYAVPIGLFLLFTVMIFIAACGYDEQIPTPTAIAQAPAAPNANADEDIPVGWTAENLEVDSYVTTATEIVIWISYEEDGTKSVSRQIRIPK